MNAYQQGKHAAVTGRAITACPFPEWTSDGKAWRVGWNEADQFQRNCAAWRPKHHG